MAQLIRERLKPKISGRLVPTNLGTTNQEAHGVANNNLHDTSYIASMQA